MAAIQQHRGDRRGGDAVEGFGEVAIDGMSVPGYGLREDCAPGGG